MERMAIVRTALWLTALVYVCSCARSVEPADPLYQTWQQTQIELASGHLIVPSDADQSTIVTFRPNGTILYGANGRYAACCFPNRFRRKANVLDFTNVTSIRVPPVDNPERCYLVDCQIQGDSWQILTLDSSKLVLKTPFGQYTYQSLP